MKKSKFSLFVVLSAIVGWIVGILTAPKSGRETRHDIKQKADQTLSSFKKEFEKLSVEANEIKSKLEQVVAKAKGTTLNTSKAKLEEAKDLQSKLKLVTSGIKSGSSDNKDLNKALKEAKNSISNLKKFLKN